MKKVKLLANSDEMRNQGFIVHNGVQLPFNVEIEMDDITLELLEGSNDGARLGASNYRIQNLSNMNVYQVMEQMGRNGFDISLSEADAVMRTVRSGGVDARLQNFSFEPEIIVQRLG